MDENQQDKPVKPRRGKPALTRRGHPKRPDPRDDALRKVVAKRFPDGAPDWVPTESIRRDIKGQFVAGAPTPNPFGARGRRELMKQRRFGMSQTVRDMLELLEQPVPIRKGKVKKEVPAIIAIYDRMIHMAIGGDWNAMKKCVELREKYSDFREKTLIGLAEEAIACRQRFKDYGEELPDQVKELLEYIDNRVVEGQFDLS